MPENLSSRIGGLYCLKDPVCDNPELKYVGTYVFSGRGHMFGRCLTCGNYPVKIPDDFKRCWNPEIFTRDGDRVRKCYKKELIPDIGYRA